MAPRRRPVAVVALVIFLGIIVGTVLGEVVGILIPEGRSIRDVFVNSTDLHIGPLHVNLIVFSVTFGFSLHLNLMSVVGIFVTALLLRWYW